MKVKVLREVHVREAKASLDAPIIGILQPGYELEVEDFSEKGDVFEDIDEWYKDKFNQYYWKGAFISDQENIAQDLRVTKNWNTAVADKYQTLMGLDGSGVGIVILDTGIDSTHHDLRHIDWGRHFRDFAEGNSTTKDGSGHGTHMTGLIAAKQTKKDFGVTGIANRSNIFVGKVAVGNSSFFPEELISALLWIADDKVPFKVHLVNMSFNLPPQFDCSNKALTDALKSIVDKGIIPIASAGEDNTLNGTIHCPAFSDDVLSVGTISDNYQKSHPSATFSNQVDIVMGETPRYSSYIKKDKYDRYRSFSKSSPATAMVTGISALLLQEKKSLKKPDLVSKLKQLAVKYTSDIDLTNPLTLIKK